MTKRRSGLTNNRKDDSANSLLEDCFTDKSCASYQKSVIFVEVVAFFNKFQKFYGIPAVSFAELEQALDYEQQNLSLSKSEWMASKFMTTIYNSLLKCFGINSDKLVTAAQLSAALFKLLKKCRSEEGLHPAEKILQPLYEADANLEVCSLSAEQKLCMISIYIDALLDRDVAQALTQSFSPDDLRITPVAIDSRMNKLWYFGDTYLFLERAEQPEPLASKKRRSGSKIADEIARANARLFTANKLEIVCKTSVDWSRLIEAYKKEKDVCNFLNHFFDAVTALENKRIRQEMLDAVISRSSSRIQQKAEEKKREEELARKEQEEKKKREMEKKKRLEEERLKNMCTYRAKATTSSENLETVSQSREERLQLREQRKLEQKLNQSRNVQHFNSPALSSSTKDSSTKNVVHSSSPNNHFIERLESLHGSSTRTSNNVKKAESKEHNYPSNRFSEADKSKIRDALGIQKTSQHDPLSRPSSSTRLNGFELANLKKYVKRPGEAQQQQFFQRVAPATGEGYIWAPIRSSANEYAIGRSINNLQNGQRQYISAASYRVLDDSHSVNFPVVRPVKYFVPVKQYVAGEHDYSRHSFAHYFSEEQQDKEYEVQRNPTQHSFNR